MHGTVVMLMALSGLGCHHKHADVAYVPSCYTSSYDSCYTSSYEPSCYSGCYSSAEYVGGCYSSSCYSETSYGDPWPSCYSEKRCFLKKLFHCGGGGLFKKHHRKSYAPIETSCYSSCYSGCYSSVYEPPVFGTTMPIYETPYASTQVPSKSMYSAPAAPAASAAAPAAPAAAPALAPKTAEPEATSGSSTLPPPPPTPASAVEDAVKSITPDAPGLSPAPNAQP